MVGVLLQQNAVPFKPLVLDANMTRNDAIVALLFGIACLFAAFTNEGFSWLQKGEWGPTPRSTRIIIFGLMGAGFVFAGVRYFVRGY